MANRKVKQQPSQLPRPDERPGVGAETIPPGATHKADQRPVNARRPGPNDDADGERTMDEPNKGEREK